MFVVCAARKSDVWMAIDPATGTKLHSFSSEGVVSTTCPKPELETKAIYLARTGALAHLNHALVCLVITSTVLSRIAIVLAGSVYLPTKIGTTNFSIRDLYVHCTISNIMKRLNLEKNMIMIMSRIITAFQSY